MSISSVIESMLNSKINPTWENVIENCNRLNVKPPVSKACLSSCISITRKRLGLSPRRGKGRVLPEVINAVGAASVNVEPKKSQEPVFDAQDYIPAIDKTFFLEKEVSVLFKQLKTLSDQGKNPKALMAGPKGCGKTSISEYFAATHKRPFFDFYCPTVREGRDWFGTKGITYDANGNLMPKWFESQFVRAVETPNSVINLDEVNRVVPSVQNVLLPLMDGRKKVYFEEMGKYISVANGVVWFATANEGREYAGTYAIDDAFRDRLSSRIEVNYLSEAAEAKLLVERTGIEKDVAEKLVAVANVTRQKVNETDRRKAIGMAISTRLLLNAAEGFVASGNDVTSLRYNLANHFKKDGNETSDRAVVLSLLTGKFGNLDK